MAFVGQRLSTSSAICNWPSRNSKFGCHRESVPRREKNWRTLGALVRVELTNFSIEAG
jgi:hypothetical protein